MEVDVFTFCIKINVLYPVIIAGFIESDRVINLMIYLY